MTIKDAAVAPQMNSEGENACGIAELRIDRMAESDESRHSLTPVVPDQITRCPYCYWRLSTNCCLEGREMMKET